jgi:hypothetical protein
MAEDDRSGEQVREHMRRMLIRIAALQRRRAGVKVPPARSVNAAVEVEGENDPPRGVGDPEGPA